MKKANATYGLPGETIIEVVRTKEGEAPVKKEMTYAEWLNMEKQPGYNYSAFQKGYSQYNTNQP